MNTVRRRIRWSQLADRDLEDAHSYLAERNPEAARKFAEKVLQATDRLEEHPELGPVANDLRPRGMYRSLVCGHHRIIYRLEDEVIWILRVWDARQDPKKLFPE